MKVSEEYREILQELVDVVQALGVYREDVVLIGGLVPLLYRFHPEYKVPRQAALLTGDLDLSVPPHLALRGDRTLRRLLDESGFVVLESRGDRPGIPPKHYFQKRSRGEERLAPIHGEFLTPLSGSETDRTGKPKSPTEFQKGLTAEALRYLDLLRWEPMKMNLSKIDGLMAPKGLEIRIPRPGAYMIQKALCSRKRSPLEKRDKDLAYIFDVVVISRSNWEEVSQEIREIGKVGPLWSGWLDKARGTLQDAFLSDAGDGPEVVARIYQHDKLQAANVRRVMRQFMETVGW